MRMHWMSGVGVGMALLCAWSTAGVTAASAAPAERLRCEYLVNPAGVDSPAPRLSWIVQSTRRGEKQTAYQVLAASSAGVLARNGGDLWDSGRVPSGETTQIPYGGQPLTSATEVFWKVRWWDRDGHPSSYSRPAWWKMGLLRTIDWKARWIGRESLPAAQEALTTGLAGTQWVWYPEGNPL